MRGDFGGHSACGDVVGFRWVGLSLALGLSGATAHDATHPELSRWYSGLRANGALCCDGAEVMHLADVEWRTANGHYEVFLTGRWMDVQDWAVIHGPNLDGRTLVWPIYQNGAVAGVRCFMPGPGS